MSTTNSPIHSPAFLRRRKFLLVVPVIVLPFLFFMFYSLGGGQGTQKSPPAAGSFMGFNRELPKARFDRRDAALDKMGYYQRADADSLRKKEYGQRDPYAASVLVPGESPHKADSPRRPTPNSDTLLRRLEHLRQVLQQHPVPAAPHSYPLSPGLPTPANPPAADPQIDRLNAMLDKILRIQHPEEHRPPPTPSIPASALFQTVPAVVQDDQTLVTGATIALRLTEDTRAGDRLVPKGQMVYGIAELHNDRLQIDIHTVRTGTELYPVNWQVYDLDGLPGIHIPGMLTRDVAKQSADQGISGLNIVSLDPSLGAQAANAGIQTAKTLFSRKVRMVRVSVRAGYQVLLRDTHAARSHPSSQVDSGSYISTPQPPGFVPGGSFSHFRLEGMEMSLHDICLKDGLLWFGLVLSNRSAIDYIPEYERWFTRDRRQFKRTAMQELPLQPVFAPPLPDIAGDSTQTIWTGFQPFALPKDKELVVQIGEKGNGRLLTIIIRHHDILNARKQ